MTLADLYAMNSAPPAAYGAPPTPASTPAAPTPGAPTPSTSSPAPGAMAPAHWSKYLSTVPGDWSPQEDEAQQALAWVRQFDPNAHFAANRAADANGNWYDYAGNSDMGGSVLEYDNNKLPLNILGYHGIGGIARGTPGSGEKLVNPNAVRDDPVYGKVTAPMNLGEKFVPMDVWGPMVVGLAAGGAPLLASLASGGAIGAGATLPGVFTGANAALGGAGANAFGASAAGAIPSAARAAANRDWLGAGMSLLPVGGAALGVDPLITRAVGAVPGVYSGVQNRDWLQTLASAAPVAGAAAGVPSWATSGGLTLAQLATRRR